MANEYVDTLKHPTLDGVTISLASVTPELAQLWLERNTGNQRKVSPVAVERYSSDMAVGCWQFSGDPIRFDRDGNMIDGQHRLNAIRETGTTQILLVVEGLDPETMPVIDTGRKRLYSDIIKIREIPHHTSVATVILRTWHWDHGNYGQRGIARRHDSIHTNAAPTMQQLDVTFNAGPERGIDWVASARWGKHLSRATNGGISPGMGGFAHVLFTQIDPFLRDQFSHYLLVEPPTGRSTYPTNQLINTALRRKEEKLDDHVWLHFIFYTWNAWSKGEDVGSLRKPAIISPDSLAVPTGWKDKA